MPCAASTETVKAVFMPSRLRRVIGGRSSFSARSAVMGAQINPRPWTAINETISGVQSDAAATRSASFSRSGSSATITARPAAISAMISSMGLKSSAVAIWESRVVAQVLSVKEVLRRVRLHGRLVRCHGAAASCDWTPRFVCRTAAAEPAGRSSSR